MIQSGKYEKDKEIKDLNIKLFADGADLEGILNLNNEII